MPSPSVPTFSFPSTTEPVFSVSTSEPVFESPNHSQTSQTTQSQQLQQYHITTVSNNNAKFPYLKKEEYETWAMKMEYWIMISDHNLWNIVLNGNSRKKTGRGPKGNIMILPSVFVEEQIAVQRETKARTILLQSLPEDHMADFHHLDDARDIWMAVKARFGGNDESKKMRKSMLNQEFSEFRVSESEGLHKGYDSRGTSATTHSVFISAASTNSKMSYLDPSHSTTFTSASSSPTASSNVMENVLHSFVAESDPQQQITYEDFDQIGKLDLEELDIKWQMAMLFVRINRFEKKARRKMKFNNKDAARFDKKKVKCYKCSELGHFARECIGKQVDSKARYSSFKLKELDKSEEPKALLSVDSMLNWSDHEGEDVENGAARVYGMIAGAEEDAAGSATGDATGDVADDVSDATGDVTDDVSNAAAEFALMGISSHVHTCPFGCEHLYAELKKEFDNIKIWFLVFGGPAFGSDEVFDLSAPSIFDSSPKDVAEKPLYDRFVKAVGNAVVPRPLTGIFASSNKCLTLMIRQESPQTQRPLIFASCVQVKILIKYRSFRIVDSGCSRSMTGNKEKLDGFVKIVGGTMTFGGGDGKITGKGTIRTSKLNFENEFQLPGAVVRWYLQSSNKEQISTAAIVGHCATCLRDVHLYFTGPLLGPTRAIRSVDHKVLGTQDTNIHAGTQDDSDSECDEQVILRRSESSSILQPEDRVVLACGKSDLLLLYFDGPTCENLPTPVFTPVHTDATSLPPGHSLGSSEHSSRYPSPSDLANSIYLEISLHLFRQELVPLPDGKIAIGTKWILKNKRDARGIVVRNKARLFLAFASYMGFMVYQMDVKSAFLYGEIEEEVYVTQPKGFEDPHFPKHVYRVVKALYGLHQAPRAWSMVDDLNFWGLQKAWFKKIFKYLKGQPKLGLWYPRDSPFVLEAYSDSDYAGSHGDRKSTTGGCQFLAAAASAVPTGGSHEADIPPSSSIPSDEFAGGFDVPAGATTVKHSLRKNFRQREETDLGEEVLRKYSDWTDIMGQVHANQGLTADLLGLLKDPGADLEQASSKKSKPTEAPKSSVPDESQPTSAEVPPTATQQPTEFSSQPTVPSAEPRTHSSLVTRERSFIRVLSDDSDDSNDDDDTPIIWPAFAAWEVVPTGLGDVNALYFMDKSSKYFTHLKEILHLIDRKDLFKLYGMVVQYYEEHPLAGSGMILWGDLQVLFESHEGGTGVGVWADQQQWVIRSWRLFPFSGVYVLETISSKILYMLADTPYPFSAQLMKKMLKHTLEVEIDGIGNDLTYAEQLI
ncbi:ribonuclease H-like domain-containing protein [Tanacetum coccineum]